MSLPAPTGEAHDAGLTHARSVADRLSSAFRTRVVGQEALRTSLLVTLLGRGHLLVESVPGLAKTTAAHTLADAVGGSFSRIQCTPDLLPSDIVGTQVFETATATFSTQLGPVHANVVLLDEINRSSAKTQSAMLEAMQERQTSIAGVMHPVPDPFVVLATQNPIEHEGTYELPESQLDRFLLKEVLTYPAPVEEVAILDRVEQRAITRPLNAATQVSLDELLRAQRAVETVYVDPSIKRYIVTVVQATRPPAPALGPLERSVSAGASPRASIAFAQVARVLALLAGRNYVTPDDVRQLRYQVLRHRILLDFEAVADGIRTEQVIDAVFAAVPTP
jgi:MoxR-like ATPase